ncbi:MAG: NUDIX domain-containing protein [Candidatus Colwellbacteria bacterium]|nr:NUDIX domain-containing protein [Candidatus Colwellbacteria bacterium]
MRYMQKVVSAGIIVFRRTKEGIKFLLLYHGRNYWNFPKGKIESEEKSWQTAVREVHEETGLKANDLAFVGGFKAHERFTYQRGNEKIFKIVILYLAQTSQSHIITEEGKHEGYGWFTFSEARRVLEKHTDSQKILQRAHDFLRAKSQRRRRTDSARKNTYVPRGSATSREPARLPRSREHPVEEPRHERSAVPPRH